jgi:hypothetical protein
MLMYRAALKFQNNEWVVQQVDYVLERIHPALEQEAREGLCKDALSDCFGYGNFRRAGVREVFPLPEQLYLREVWLKFDLSSKHGSLCKGADRTSVIRAGSTVGDYVLGSPGYVQAFLDHLSAHGDLRHTARWGWGVFWFDDIAKSL